MQRSNSAQISGWDDQASGSAAWLFASGLFIVGIDTISGLPAHPLFVHIPVIGIPLVALVFLAYVLLPKKRAGLLWPAIVSIVVVTLATILAASTGESLEEQLPPEDRSSPLLHRHTELGDQTRTIVILFAAAALVYLATEWWKMHRMSSPANDSSPISTTLAHPATTKVIVVLSIVGILLGGLATVWDVRTGHAGAKSAWNDVSGQSGESGSGTGDGD